jgi:ribulose-5-phosphate 4-epimerase/fuculose-1-phosphate aldolase
MRFERKKKEIAAAHRALAAYGLNEGVNDGFSMKISFCYKNVTIVNQ